MSAAPTYALAALTLASLLRLVPAQHCEYLEAKYVEISNVPRFVSVRGREAKVSFEWNSNTSRAAAALHIALLRNVLQYQRLEMRRGNATGHKDLVVGLLPAREAEATTWKSALSPRLRPGCHLHAQLTPDARAYSFCKQHTHWSFYANATLRALCGFTDIFQYGETSETMLYGLKECLNTMKGLKAGIVPLPIRLQLVNRSKLVELSETTNHSFLFVDYDYWKGMPNVSYVQPPPCVHKDTACLLQVDNPIAVRFTTSTDMLEEYAPPVIQLIHDIIPSSKSLRYILEQESNGADIEDAACEWALKLENVLESWLQRNKYVSTDYWLAVIYCNNDPDISEQNKVLKQVGYEILKKTKHMHITIGVLSYFINCADVYSAGDKIKHMMSKQSNFWWKLIGVIMDGGLSTTAIAGLTASYYHVPLLLYGMPASDVTASSSAVWRVSGRLRHLTLALKHFVTTSHWTHIAVLSEPTQYAKEYLDALRDEGINVKDYYIPLKLGKLQAIKALQELKFANERNVLVNADSEDAVVILCAALHLGMSSANGYNWIVRDLHPTKATNEMNMTYVTVSLWSRRDDIILFGEGNYELRSLLNHTSAEGEWPARAVSLADAVLTLGNGWNDVFHRYPNAQYYLHTEYILRKLTNSLDESPVRGSSQFLHYNKQSIEDTLVFVDKWHQNTFDRLQTLRVNATSGTVTRVHGWRS